MADHLGNCSSETLYTFNLFPSPFHSLFLSNSSQHLPFSSCSFLFFSFIFTTLVLSYFKFLLLFSFFFSSLFISLFPLLISLSSLFISFHISFFSSFYSLFFILIFFSTVENFFSFYFLFMSFFSLHLPPLSLSTIFCSFQLITFSFTLLLSLLILYSTPKKRHPRYDAKLHLEVGIQLWGLRNTFPLLTQNYSTCYDPVYGSNRSV